ncbi:hypothetical protein [Methylomonas rivi]|uniref:Glyoxalase n=1 Tax=Methylomonas rivi TaxID=2952226 RepID=A0ABT1U2Y6_9GAMM|nr:hypothetical protein [Methylomonas sp. WSC-6]MCQ8127774.1 hypothetical protein [Methylomonas sp. WSC-6]
MNDNIAMWFELPVNDMAPAKAFYRKVPRAEDRTFADGRSPRDFVVRMSCR